MLQNGTWIIVWFGSITRLASFEQLCNFTTVHSVPLKMCTSPNVHQICTSPLKSLQVCTSPSVYIFKCVPLQVCTTCSLILTARSTSAASSIRYRCHQSHHYHPCWRQIFILIILKIATIIIFIIKSIIIIKKHLGCWTLNIE